MAAAVPIIVAHMRERDECEDGLPWQPRARLDSEVSSEDVHSKSIEDLLAAGLEQSAQDGYTGNDEENLAKLIWAAGVIKRFFRYRLNRTRLDHRNLTDRLIFEGEFVKGIVRLSLQILLFTFLVLGSMKSASNADSSGLYSEIVDSFELETISHVKTSRQFLTDFLPRIAATSR